MRKPRPGQPPLVSSAQLVTPPAGASVRPASGDIEALMLDFLAYLELERGLSRNTLEAYRSDLLQLGRFLERRHVSVIAAQHGDLAAFISELAGTTQVPGGRPPAAASTLGRKDACL